MAERKRRPQWPQRSEEGGAEIAFGGTIATHRPSAPGGFLVLLAHAEGSFIDYLLSKGVHLGRNKQTPISSEIFLLPMENLFFFLI